jgi:hypothetical protein
MTMLNATDNQNSTFMESARDGRKVTFQGLTLYDGLMLLIGITSALAIVLISINQFDVSLLIGFSVTLTVITLLLTGSRGIIKDDRLAHTSILLILVVAIIFRIGSFTYFLGGQDEGLYVNMSGTLVANQGVNIYDAFRASLPEDLRIIYDNVNYDNVNRTNSGGVLLADANNSISQIKFYPLNGVWLAIFKTIFGLGKHGYATQFFSLLVVVGVYLLTLELTAGNRKAAMIAMAFAALNPSFVFFAKFPVSETIAMAFSLNGYYLLIKGLRSSFKKERILLLVSSALLLGMFNWVRLSFIVFLPTFAVILLAVFLFSGLRKYRLPVSLYVAGVTTLFALSWLYYFLVQPLVASRSMEVWFTPLIKGSLPILIVLAIAGILLVWLGSRFSEKVDRLATRLTQKVQLISTWIIPVALVLSIFQVVAAYRNDEFYNLTLGNIYNFMLLVSPFVFTFLFAMPFLKIRFDRIHLFLILTITVAWIALFISGFGRISYKYYYARYMTSEMLLYSIILVAIGLSFMLERGKKYRVAATVVTVSTVVYFCLFSSFQIGRTETEDPQMYYELNNLISQKDVVVSYLPQYISFPLQYYFRKNVFQLPALDHTDGNEVLNHLYDSGAYENVYILTNSLYRSDYEQLGLTLIGQYNFKFSYFSNGLHTRPGPNDSSVGLSQYFLPLNYIVENRSIYLYKLTRDIKVDITRELDINCGVNGNLGLFAGQGFSYNEPDHTWTDGKTATLSINITNSYLLKTDLNFTMDVYAFTNLVHNQRVTIYVNSQQVYQGNVGGEYNSISFLIPVDLVRGQDTLEIMFMLPDASSSTIDPRALGLSFKSISIIPER